MTYDTAKHEVKVNVQITAKVNLLQLLQVTTQPSPTLIKQLKQVQRLQLRKSWKVKPLKLINTNSSLKKVTKSLRQLKNAADGTVTFPAISYDAAGPHTYTITEKQVAKQV